MKFSRFFSFTLLALCFIACSSDMPPDKPNFTPLDPFSWASLRYPGTLDAPAPRLVISESGELLLDGTVISAEQLPTFLPKTRGNKERLEILAAPNATFGLVFSLVSEALASGRTDLSFLVSSRNGAPGLVPGLSWKITPILALELRANGVIPSLSGRENNTEILLAVSDAVTIDKAFEAVEQLNGCDQKPCDSPPRKIVLQRSSQGALNAYYSVGKGVFTKGVEVKSPALKSPDQARKEALLQCPEAENASVVEVDCETAELPANKVLKGSTQKLSFARVCYRVFMDCSDFGPLVVYIDGDNGDVLLEASD
jgi:hypothetical protein